MPDNYEVLNVEQEVNLDIDGYKFIGYIDLVIRDKEDNKIIIFDHKSKSKFKNKTEHQEYLRQLYLYAIYVKEQYGEYPKQLIFNMFRAGQIIKANFNIDDYEKTKEWFIRTIKQIENDTKFYDKIFLEYQHKNKDISDYKNDDFFCCYLCGSRMFCERSKDYKEAVTKDFNRKGTDSKS